MSQQPDPTIYVQLTLANPTTLYSPVSSNPSSPPPPHPLIMFQIKITVYSFCYRYFQIILGRSIFENVSSKHL